MPDSGYPWPIETTRLDNGLRVVVSEDRTAPAVAVNLWYDVGSRHEPDGQTGFAHLFEHLMFEGSVNVAEDRAHEADPGRRRLAQRHHQPGPDQLLRDGPGRAPGAGALAGGRPDGRPGAGADPGDAGQPARGGEERAPPALRERAVRRRLAAAAAAALPAGPPVPPRHDRLDGRPERRRPGHLPGLPPHATTRRTTRCSRWSATPPPAEVFALADKYFGAHARRAPTSRRRRTAAACRPPGGRPWRRSPPTCRRRGSTSRTAPTRSAAPGTTW